MSTQDDLELATQRLSSDVTLLSLLASLDGASIRAVAVDLIAIRAKLSELIASAYEREAA